MKARFTVDEMNAWVDKKLKENPHWNEASEKQDIPDLIAGALGVSRGTSYDLMRDALAKQYAEKNSLGGPAKVFDAMADAIRAGDDYHAVLRQYRFVEAQKQEPVSSDEIGTGCECANCANGMGECQKEEAQTQQEPMFWYRPCSNGMYEGPIHNAQIERVRKESGAWHPLYTSPPASKPWVGLTEDDKLAIRRQSWETPADLIKNTEAKCKEKNA